MGLTTDPSDPRLTHGVDDEPKGMAPVYLVLSEEERAKGFVRPLRRSYKHIGPAGPRFPLADLTDKQKEIYGTAYVKYEKYPDEEKPAVGRFWTQADLDASRKGGCGAVTHMGLALCETYARNPLFYGATYCVGCQMHKPVGEFAWEEDGAIVGS